MADLTHEVLVALGALGEKVDGVAKGLGERFDRLEDRFEKSETTRVEAQAAHSEFRGHTSARLASIDERVAVLADRNGAAGLAVPVAPNGTAAEERVIGRLVSRYWPAIVGVLGLLMGGGGVASRWMDGPAPASSPASAPSSTPSPASTAAPP